MSRNRARLRTVILLSAIAAMASAGFSQTTSQPKMVELSPFEVVGIAASTNNAKEAGPDAIIGKMWHGFRSEDLFDKIPGRVDPSIYAVYTDYASDANGQYTIILGAKESRFRTLRFRMAWW